MVESTPTYDKVIMSVVILSGVVVVFAVGAMVVSRF